MSQSSNAKKIFIFQLITVFAGFIIFGFSENIKGPAIPRIQFDFMLNETQLGTLLALNALGYLIACSFTAYLVKLWGIKIVSIISFSCMILSGVLIFLSHSFSFFTGSYFLMYIGNGMLEIALAILCARIFVKNTGFMMNLTHGFYGLSSTVAPLLATGIMSMTINDTAIDWQGMYLLVLLLSLIPIVFTLFSSFPEDEIKHEDKLPLKVLIKDPVLWMMVSILTFGVVSELAVGGWLVNFLEKAYSWDTVKASSMLSMFFLCFALARIFLGLLTDKIGFVMSLILFAGFSALCTFFAIVGGESVAFLFAASGIGIAMIYPTVMAFIAKRYVNGSETAITLTVTLMGIGSVIGNYIIGGLIDIVKAWNGSETEFGLIRGLQAGYLFIGLCAALSAISAIILYVYMKKQRHKVL